MIVVACSVLITSGWVETLTGKESQCHRNGPHFRDDMQNCFHMKAVSGLRFNTLYSSRHIDHFRVRASWLAQLPGSTAHSQRALRSLAELFLKRQALQFLAYAVSSNPLLLLPPNPNFLFRFPKPILPTPELHLPHSQFVVSPITLSSIHIKTPAMLRTLNPRTEHDSKIFNVV